MGPARPQSAEGVFYARARRGLPAPLARGHPDLPAVHAGPWLRTTGYTGAQFEVLRELAVADGRSTVSALARALALDPAAVTRLVADLTTLEPRRARERWSMTGGGGRWSSQTRAAVT